MSIEERRVAEELAREAARRDASERARREVEARVEAEARARVLVEEQRKLAEASLRRQEEAEREALKLATIERMRLEALERSRVQVMELAQTHERELLALKNDVDKRRLKRNIAMIVSVSVLLFGSALGLYFGKLRPETQARQAALESEADKKAAETERLKIESRDSDARIKRLQDERNAVLSATPTAEPVAPPTPPLRKPPPPKITDKKWCPPGANPLDPLNECF